MIQSEISVSRMRVMDNEIFGPDEPTRTRTNGRPKVNRDLARRLFEAERYTTGQIATQLTCSEETVRRVRRELEADGLLAQVNGALSDGYEDFRDLEEAVEALIVEYHEAVEEAEDKGGS